MPEIVLFDCHDFGILGLNTRNSGIALPAGIWKGINNWRWCGEGPLRVRDGLGVTLGTIGSTGTPCGLETLNIAGTPTHFAANREGSETLIYKSTDAVTWTEITAASGQYGNTRFTTAGNVFFEVARHPDAPSTDLVVIQNGTDTPRVYDGSNVVKHEAITADEKGAKMKLTLTLAGYATIYNSAGTTCTATGVTNQADFYMADVGGSSTNNYISMRATGGGGGVAINDIARCVTSAWGGGANPKQFIIVMDSAYTQWFDNCKVSIDDGTHTVVLWDPTDTTGAYAAPYPRPMSMTGTNNNQGTLNAWVFPINASDAYDLTQFTGLSFTWVQGTLAAGTYFNLIYAWGLSGGVFPGDTEFALARHNTGSKAYSPACIYSQKQGARIRDIGGPQDRTDRLPISADIYYQVKANYTYASAADVAKGVDQVSFFFKRTQDVRFIKNSNSTLSSWAPSTWTASGVAGTVATASLDSSSTITPGYHQWMVPDEQHITIPIGRQMLRTNGRLFVMAKGDTNGGPGLYFSALDNDFSFRVNQDPNQGEYSPSSNSIAGEVAQGLTGSATDIFGVSRIFVFTDSYVYGTGGVLASQLSNMYPLAPHGTINPYTIWEYLGQVFWLDQEMNVQRFKDGQVANLSQFQVDDNLGGFGDATGVPTAYRTLVMAGLYKGRYYLPFTPMGGTVNNKTLVWNVLLEKWESVDIYAAHDVAFTSRWVTATGTSNILTVGSDRTVRYLEVDGHHVDGDSTPIVGTLTSWGIRYTNPKAPAFSEMTIGQLSILADAKVATWTTTRTFPRAGTIGGTITTSAGSTVLWLIDAITAPSGDAFGIYGTVTLSASTSAGGVLYRVSAEVDKTSGAASANG